MHARENVLKEWLTLTLNAPDIQWTILAGDASFRRYLRVKHNDLTYVVMDAPPEKENLEPFIRIAEILDQAGVHTPYIFAKNLEHGFLLLSDLGDKTLLHALRAETANDYYHQAIKILFQIQSCSITDSFIPSFDKPHMLQEMSLCSEWFFKAYLSLNFDSNELALIQESMEWIAAEVAKQPLVFIHRDYHSRNLLIYHGPKESDLAVIDFQDAMRGPLTYDLVSLLKDCYISWPRTKILEWVHFFYTQSISACNYTFPEFVRAFDLCGVQRHLKVLGIFCRLHLRDNKTGYLKDLPLTLNYLIECCMIYEELKPLSYFLERACSSLKLRVPMEMS